MELYLSGVVCPVYVSVFACWMIVYVERAYLSHLCDRYTVRLFLFFNREKRCI